MMVIDKQVLIAIGVTGDRADKFLPDLNALLPKYKIDTPLRIAHFLAQVAHESAMMKATEENLNYSSQGLLKIFPKYFSAQLANAYARKPEKIANKVYGNRMGNGDEASGDGYRYRGRGLIQLTGKSNYSNFKKWLGDDVVANPDLVATKYAVHSAVFFWSENNLNALADTDDVAKVTKRINGGTHGLDDRKRLLDLAKKALGSAKVVAPTSSNLAKATHRVTANSLNLRRQPQLDPQNIIGALAKNQDVIKLGDVDAQGWIKVSAMVGGQVKEGFVASQYLQAIA